MSNCNLGNNPMLILLTAPILIVACLYIGIDCYIGTTSIAYGLSDLNQVKSITANSTIIEDIPVEKARVSDIDIAYKTMGNGKPVMLISGASQGIDGWDQSTLTSLSSNHTVVVFDPRGVGNTSIGSKPYSMQQLANDTAGLMDALKIKEAHVLGYSLGSEIAQQLTVTYPEKVSSLVLVASTCGGKDGIPKPPEFIKLQADITNKSLNNVSIPQDAINTLLSASYGSGWIKLYPETVENFPTAEEVFTSIAPDTLRGQYEAGIGWEATNWNGACNELAKLAKPTLIITGTDDNDYIPHVNSLILAQKIPGAWLMQIKNAGHAVMAQYPDEINKILQIFLSTTSQHD